MCLNQPPAYGGKGLFGELAICIINTGAYVAGKRTLSSESRHRSIKEPAVFAVMPTEPILHLEGLTRIERFGVGIQTHGQVFRVDSFCPAVSKLRLQGPAGEVEPGLIEVVAQLVETRCPDHHRSGVGDQAEPLLALQQRLLRPLALGNVLGGAAEVGYTARRIAHGDATNSKPPRAAIPTYHFQLEFPN